MGKSADSPPPNAIDGIVEAQHEEGKAIRKEIGTLRKTLDLLLKVAEDLRGEVEDLASVADGIRVELNDVKKRVVTNADLEKVAGDVQILLSRLGDNGD